MLRRQIDTSFSQSTDFSNEDKHGDITVSREPRKSSKSRKTPSSLKDDAIKNKPGNIRKPLFINVTTVCILL